MCWRRCTEPGGCAGRETPEELSLCLQDAGLRSLPGAWACTVPLPGAAARASGLGPPAPLSVFCLRVRWWQPVFPAVQAVGARSPAARLLRFRTRCPHPLPPTTSCFLWLHPLCQSAGLAAAPPRPLKGPVCCSESGPSPPRPGGRPCPHPCAVATLLGGGLRTLFGGPALPTSPHFPF